MGLEGLYKEFRSEMNNIPGKRLPKLERNIKKQRKLRNKEITCYKPNKEEQKRLMALMPEARRKSMALGKTSDYFKARPMIEIVEEK